MTGRRRVSIRIEYLVRIKERPEPAFFTDWACRLCPKTGYAVDSSAALDECADHLRESHRASGGRIRRRPA
jgi:hypothetical protein